ncbi:non-homologous end-joining DNA ligase [Nocardia seriolae]|nr:non-homologous end-joining DNA ligase [Nocardia seriolae]GEM26033.1 ATP-dependent DNA ligase [Nocardia seriolae NBRC 15557]WKY49675.1 non-homologous end-joining DNA ligase [Nocardia seriolae]BAW06566.1 DNA polymerase [Nocardia seriolae]BEK87904.1 ATP-dependent DNA ligase [Nocardia seriolae]BEK96610.1 ATP-dependent DNA ligase [Nocardia seriolae]
MSGLPHYAPMLATAGIVPGDDAQWSYEVKFDGIRAIGYIGEELRLLSRNDRNITAAWPELAGLAPSDPPFVVDGEIVAFAPDGRSSFAALQPRMHQRNPATIAALAAATPATYMIFDLLHIGDRPLINLPYEQRRQLLEQLAPHGPHWQTPPRLNGPGTAVLEQSRRLGLEGIICKRLDSTYQPGRRSPRWIKVKNIRDQEIVIVGWRPGSGARAGHIGSLLMAVHDATGPLTYIGNVGTGFTRATLDALAAKLEPLQRHTPTVAAPVPDAVWVEPELVGEVSYSDWTTDGRLRHPSWRGLRADKTPREVTLPDDR